jgi:hypothetical protein
MKLLLLLLLLTSACKKSDFNLQSSKTLVSLKQPVIYARYETLPALLRTKSGACSNAYAFKAPDRYRLGTYMDLCGTIGQKDPWLLPSGFQSFYWEQDIGDTQKIQLELIGSDGIPLPSYVTVSKIADRIILQLKPADIILRDKIYLIVASLLDNSGKKLNSWSVPFKIGF